MNFEFPFFKKKKDANLPSIFRIRQTETRRVENVKKRESTSFQWAVHFLKLLHEQRFLFIVVVEN